MWNYLADVSMRYQPCNNIIIYRCLIRLGSGQGHSLLVYIPTAQRGIKHLRASTKYSASNQWNYRTTTPLYYHVMELSYDHTALLSRHVSGSEQSFLINMD